MFVDGVHPLAQRDPVVECEVDPRFDGVMTDGVDIPGETLLVGAP